MVDTILFCYAFPSSALSSPRVMIAYRNEETRGFKNGCFSSCALQLLGWSTVGLEKTKGVCAYDTKQFFMVKAVLLNLQCALCHLKRATAQIPSPSSDSRGKLLMKLRV